METANTVFFGFTFATALNNDATTSRQIISDLRDAYGVGCDSPSPCLVYDLNQNGFDMGDLTARYPLWMDSLSITDYIPIVDCL